MCIVRTNIAHHFFLESIDCNVMDFFESFLPDVPETALYDRDLEQPLTFSNLSVDNPKKFFFLD